MNCSSCAKRRDRIRKALNRKRRIQLQLSDGGVYRVDDQLHTDYGIACGGGFISHRKKCSEGKQKATPPKGRAKNNAIKEAARRLNSRRTKAGKKPVEWSSAQIKDELATMNRSKGRDRAGKIQRNEEGKAMGVNVRNRAAAKNDPRGKGVAPQIDKPSEFLPREIDHSKRKTKAVLQRIEKRSAAKSNDAELEALMSKVSKANAQFEKTAKKARNVSKTRKQKPGLEDELKTVAAQRSKDKQEKLADRAKMQIESLNELGREAKGEADDRAKLEKLAKEAPKQVKSFKRAKKRMEERKAKRKADKAKKALKTKLKGKRKAKNAIRRFNRKADAMGWPEAVRLDAIAYLLEHLDRGVAKAVSDYFSKMKKRRKDSTDTAYYFMDPRTGQKRNTAVFAPSLAAAKRKLRRPSPKVAKCYKRRKPKPGEIKAGIWSRVRPDGKGPNESRYTGAGFGPKR